MNHNYSVQKSPYLKSKKAGQIMRLTHEDQKVLIRNERTSGFLQKVQSPH